MKKLLLLIPLFLLLSVLKSYSQCNLSIIKTKQIAGNYTFSVYPIDSSSYYVWDFGDGSPTANQSTVYHSFDTTFTAAYFVTVMKYSLDTCSATDSIFINAPVVLPPACNIAISSEKNSDYQFYFTALELNTGYFENPMNVNWDFGDGNGITGATTTNHQYSNPGTYLVTLSYDNGSEICSYESYVSVLPTQNQCDNFYIQQSKISTTDYVYQAFGLDTLGTYDWKFTDSATAYSEYFNNAGVYVSQTYPGPGYYFVQATYKKDTLMCQASYSTPIQEAVNCNFTINTKITNNVVEFSAALTEPRVGKFDWYFGDNNYGRGNSVVNYYSQADTFVVMAYFTSEDGKCYSYVYDTVQISNVSNTFYNLAGVVSMDSLNLNENCNVSIFRVKDNGYELYRNFPILYNGFGLSLPAGKYIVLLMPNEELTNLGLIATYFGGTESWKNAQVIDLTTDLNIELQLNTIIYKDLIWNTGTDVIRGKVTLASLAQAKTTEAQTVENTVVILYNSSGDRLTSTYTDPFGNYSFENIAAGDYSIEVEYPGSASGGRIDVSTDGDPETVSSQDLTLRIENVNGINKISINELSLSAHPNPVKDILSLTFDNTLSSKSAEISIVSQEGLVIYRDEMIVNNNFTIQTSLLNPGFYLLSVKSQDFTLQKKIIKQ